LSAGTAWASELQRVSVSGRLIEPSMKPPLRSAVTRESIIISCGCCVANSYEAFGSDDGGAIDALRADDFLACGGCLARQCEGKADK